VCSGLKVLRLGGGLRQQRPRLVRVRRPGDLGVLTDAADVLRQLGVGLLAQRGGLGFGAGDQVPHRLLGPRGVRRRGRQRRVDLGTGGLPGGCDLLGDSRAQPADLVVGGGALGRHLLPDRRRLRLDLVAQPGGVRLGALPQGRQLGLQRGAPGDGRLFGGGVPPSQFGVDLGDPDADALVRFGGGLRAQPGRLGGLGFGSGEQLGGLATSVGDHLVRGSLGGHRDQRSLVAGIGQQGHRVGSGLVQPRRRRREGGLHLGLPGRGLAQARRALRPGLFDLGADAVGLFLRLGAQPIGQDLGLGEDRGGVPGQLGVSGRRGAARRPWIQHAAMIRRALRPRNSQACRCGASLHRGCRLRDPARRGPRETRRIECGRALSLHAIAAG